MTFYWWSHWFWITILCNLIFPGVVVVVHTYPSQESTLLYNNHQQENTKKLVTRLYQTSTITWTTNVPNYFAKTTSAGGNLKLQHVAKINGKLRTETTTQQQVIVPAQANVNDNEEEVYFYDYDVTEDVNQKLNLEQVEVDLERKEQVSASLNNKKPCHEVDVKRSAEDQLKNKTASDATRDLKLFVTPTTAALMETNNYTNFTNKNNLTSTNAIAALLNATIANTTTTTMINTSDTVTAITNATTQIPQVPSTPKIVKAQIGKFDWFNSVGGHLPSTQVTTDAATDNNNEQQQPPHKIPFTLENVNKPEDLKREEGEHRTRKSKGLSSDYKINPYINYSSDSKNLLTRSAVTTVNEYDSEESNISSEALSVQRAYFMDVGAISAICFTVFGICCTVGTVGIVLYRRRFLNKPQALSEPDSSVYIDDSTMRVSDNSDEMYSLDNDSFLNSLEAMTIQNYWTDTVKHTKL